jgi:hypothetical protein
LVGSGLGDPGDFMLGLHQGEEFPVRHRLRSDNYGLAACFGNVGNTGKMIIVGMGGDNSIDFAGRVYANAPKVRQRCDLATALVFA